MIRLNANTMLGTATPSRTSEAREISERQQPTQKRGDSVALGTKDDHGPGQPLTVEQVRQAKIESGAQARAKVKDAGREFEFRTAVKALPKNSSGQIKPEALAHHDQRASLTQAVERLMTEGFGSSAELAFEKAVNALFAEYADDLGLDEGEIARAKALMVAEVRQAVEQSMEVRPWSPYEFEKQGAEDMEATIERIQGQVLDRRQLLMEASGDLSRVLAELTVDAQTGGDSEATDLGDFLSRFGDAVRSRTTKNLRDTARGFLLQPVIEAPSQPDAQDWGAAFLDYLDAA
jgi:hypothetical protein